MWNYKRLLVLLSYIAIIFLNNQNVIAIENFNQKNYTKILLMNENEKIGQSVLNFSIPIYLNKNINNNNNSNIYNNNNYLPNNYNFYKLTKNINNEENKYLKILYNKNKVNIISPPKKSYELINSTNYFIKNNNKFLNNSIKVPFKNDNKILKRKQRESTESLCQNECNCTRDRTFLNIECEFLVNQKQYTIGRAFYIPKDAKFLKIILGPQSKLRLDSNSFSNRMINSLVIEGDKIGKELEISQNAFNGNNAVFLKINITNISTVIFRHNAFSDYTKEKHEFVLHVNTVDEVIIHKEAFNSTAFHGLFTNINNMKIQPRGFFGTSESLITIESSKIDKFGRLESALKEIRFSNSFINEITTEAFNVIHLTVVRFMNCRIGVIESNVFTAKLYGKEWEFIECQIGTIRKNAIDQSGVSSLKFERNSIDIIEPNAIAVTSGKLSFSYNEVKKLGTQWLSVKDWNNVTIFNNTFGLYSGINIGKTVNPVQCVFEKNSITKAEEGSLNITNWNCKIREIYFYNVCSCKVDWIDKLSNQDIKAESFCRIEILKFCFNSSIFNVKNYLDVVCGDESDIINCIKNQNKNRVTDEKFIEPSVLDENYINRNFYIYIGIAVFVLIILIILVLSTIQFCLRKRPITIPLSQMSNNQSTLTNVKNNTRAFSNDDRIIINQTLETMKSKHSPEKYDQVYNNTKKLMEGNLTESEKVLTIGEIVRTIEDCQNSGDDFVAFTGILYNHLAPSDGTSQNDIVYAEPNLLRDDPRNADGYNRDEDGQTMLDHIYAEPHSVQQPLLPNEYSTPHDRNDIGGVYTEPITNERERTVISPYAIGNQLNMNPTPPPLNSLPSTSKNLPDVLSQSSKPSHLNDPTTSRVKQIAENFANNPNFHITRSPTTNRRIPQYTIPNKSNASTHLNSLNNKNNSNDEIDGIGAVASSSRYLGNNNNNNNSNDTDSTNSHSDHSGGSDITFKIDEIDYVDA